MATTLDRSKLDLDGTEAENLATWLETHAFKGFAANDARLSDARANEAYKALREAFDKRDADARAAFAEALSTDVQGRVAAGDDAAAAIHHDFADAMARATRREGVSGAMDYLTGADTKPFLDAAGFDSLAQAIRDGVFAPEKKKAGLLLWLLPLLLLGGAALGSAAYLMRDTPSSDETVSIARAPAPEAPKADLAPAAPIEPAPEPEPIAAPVAAEPAPVAAQPPKKPLFGSPKWVESSRFEGKDMAGRPASFVAYVLTSDDTFAFARHDALRIEAENVTYPLSATFADAPFADGFCDLDAMVTVGAASHEGAEALNATLASNRAEGVRDAMSAAAPNCEAPPQKLQMILGRNRIAIACDETDLPCPDRSAHQRPFALIAVERDDPSTDIVEALKDGLAAHEAGGGAVLPRVKLNEYTELTIK